MIRRGAIVEIRQLPGARGHERQGNRYAVVIQSDQFATSTVTVAMTSTSAASAVYRPEIEFDGRTTRILTDQIYSVDPAARFGAFKGALDAEELRDLDRALMLKLGLF
ncbi:type II toxin-antitoxin system PemK/MazF family toxin [Streptomyces sp. NPDC090109]|uniref:type II toxin-antitoxin system PemK/MazF family toxin n=1 Tax=unclassified Streptomyces TaxID=2593676 RepID=UPI00137203AF|nr:type II toxin-antitoxin system PemK/MazF family toxin [Streptomyces sp. SID5770]MZE56686.1 type II toxin-antitoxin system PemK/MazF family toxin [Streptomyces sp. SID5770]